MWPDAGVTVAVLTQSGVHLTRGPRLGRDNGWVLLDRPQSPRSRDVALAISGGRAYVAWSGQDGLRYAAISRGDLRQPGLLDVGVPERIAPTSGPAGTGAGSEPSGPPSISYPIAAFMDEDATLDLFWTPDRTELRRLTVRRGFGPGYPQTLPAVTPTGSDVRLRALDLASESAKTAWLTCTTDRGRIALARWDLGQDVHTSWHEVEAPESAQGSAGAALVRIGDVPVLLVAAPDGRILGADARAANAGDAAWRAVELPPSTEGRRVEAIAASDNAGRAWLAASGAGRLWLAPLYLRDGRLMCGDVHDEAMAG